MKTKKILLILLLAVIPLGASAQAITAKVNGLWYTIMLRNNTCWVSYVPEGYPEYAGDIVIPSTIEYKGNTLQVKEIEMTAFAGYKKVTSVVISEGVTEIGMSAFDGCSGLQRVHLPSTLKKIEADAFSSCKNLKEIRCDATAVPNTESGVFKETKVENVTLIVPSSAIQAYKSSPVWKKFNYKK